MEITDVRIFKNKKGGPLIAYANVVFNNCFAVKGIKLIETENGRRLSMPSKKTKNPEMKYRDICHPITKKTREEMTEKIFAVYDKYIKK